MSEREIIRVCIDDEGQLDVTVARLCPEAKAGRLANEVAEAVVRLLGERALRDFRRPNPAARVTH